MFSRLKRQLAVFAPLGAGLLIITLLTALSGLWHYQNELNHQPASKALTGTFVAASFQKEISGNGPAIAPQSGDGTTNPHSDTNGPFVPGSSSPGNSGSPATVASSSPKSQSKKPAPTIISLSLSVNGQVKGSVRLAAGSNQCDVLSNALAEGVISNLDMRYSQSYGTEGVYVINGIGDPGSVWWTYKVNGTAPPYGCAYVTARPGDSVNWQYIK